MNYTSVYDRPERLPVTSERVLPEKSFPRKYIHSVVDDLLYAVRAVHALRSLGYPPEDIHVMASWDYIEAIEQKEQRQKKLAKLVSCLMALLDDSFSDVYLRAALKGSHILMVHLTRPDQMEQVRALLVHHSAYLIKYVDFWTVTDLPSYR